MPIAHSTMQVIAIVVGMTSPAISVLRTSAIKKKVVATASTRPMSTLSRTLVTA